MIKKKLFDIQQNKLNKHNKLNKRVDTLFFIFINTNNF